MPERVEEFYAALSVEYDKRIRQLVPKYDEMVECIVDLVRERAPRSVLDIGTGVGTISWLVLKALPYVSVTAIEPGREMAAAARHTLSEFGSRASLIEVDARDFVPDSRVDVVVSSLVLHNISPADKTVLISRIHEWLGSEGIFVWADLVRHSDPQLQQFFVRKRQDFARASGCPIELLHRNFEKEGEVDFPLTIRDSIDLGRRGGFPAGEIVWARDSFAILVFRATGTTSHRVLATQRLELRPYELTDSAALHRVWTDPKVREFLWDGEVISPERARHTVTDSVNDWATLGYGQWTIHFRDRPGVIGFCGFRNAAWDDAPEFLCGLLPSHWHRGLAAEAALAVLQFAFESLGFERVVAATDVPNRASIRLIERLGMTFERRGILHGLDTMFYRLERDQFRATATERGNTNRSTPN